MTEAERAPGGPFGLVIFSLNGLMHLSTMAEQRAALASARRALDPRGMLVIDALNPTLSCWRRSMAASSTRGLGGKPTAP